MKAQYARLIARIADDAVHLHRRASLLLGKRQEIRILATRTRRRRAMFFLARAAADLAGQRDRGNGNYARFHPRPEGAAAHRQIGVRHPYRLWAESVFDERHYDVQHAGKFLFGDGDALARLRAPRVCHFLRPSGVVTELGQVACGFLRLGACAHIGPSCHGRALAGHEVGAEVATDHGGAKLARMPLRLDEQALCADGPLLAAIVIGPAFARLPHAFALRLSGPAVRLDLSRHRRWRHVKASRYG